MCLGTNLRFITAISSLANLFPDATFVPGGSVPGRWWGLLPSIPRVAWFPGRGFVLGPYITSRSRDSAGNAVITFRVPFVSNSTGLTTDGKAGYDPKALGRLRRRMDAECAIGAWPRSSTTAAWPGRPGSATIPSCSKRASLRCAASARGVAEPAERGERERFLVAVLDAVRLGDRELQRLARGFEPPRHEMRLPEHPVEHREHERARPRRSLARASVRAASSAARSCSPPSSSASATRASISSDADRFPVFSCSAPRLLELRKRALEVAAAGVEQRGLHHRLGDVGHAAGRPAGALGLAQQRLGLVEPALGREDLADVEARHRDAARVARLIPGRDGLAVESSASFQRPAKYAIAPRLLSTPPWLTRSPSSP